MSTALEQAQAWMREWPMPNEPGTDEFVEWVNDFTAAFDLDRGDQAECDAFEAWCEANNADIVDLYNNHRGVLGEGITMVEAMNTLYANYVLTELAVPGVAVGAWQELTILIWFDPSNQSEPRKWAWEELLDTEVRIVEHKDAEYLDAAGSPVPHV